MKLEKHRYLILKIYANITFSERQFISRIWDSIYELFGCKGASETGLWLVDFDINEKRGIIRCNLESLNQVKVALILITEILRNNPIMIRILGISGTIKRAKEKFY